jgi:tRNA pseudouridine38-40 synthase
MKIALGLEYCGTKYSGWQRLKHTVSVQQCVETALSRVADQMVTVYCAGRTDAGVHALHQVIHFETEAEREMHSWVQGGNVNLPGDISLLWAKTAEPDFHARHSATGRAYRYIILNRPSRPGLLERLVTWEYRPLDEQRMQEATRYLLGEHDFSAFRSAECQSRSAVRTIRRLEITRRGNYVMIDIEANGFLHHMVRNIAGVLMDIGHGKAGVEWTEEVLNGRDRTRGGVTAPPDGLYLMQVFYPEKFAIPGPEENRIFPPPTLTG